MKNLTKMVLGSVGLMGLFASTPAAFAQDAAAAPAPDWSVAGTIDAQSDYRFRGISQSNRNVVPQGALNVTGPDGFYVGTWVSQINWQVGVNVNPAIEWDIYGGKHFDLGGTDDVAQLVIDKKHLRRLPFPLTHHHQRTNVLLGHDIDPIAHHPVRRYGDQQAAFYSEYFP